MGQYQGISTSVFDEPEYRDTTEMVVAQYVMMHRDLAGVCPIYAPKVAASCRITPKTLLTTLAYFAEIGKIEFSSDRSHVFWKSGPAHSLYHGKFSPQQQKGLVDTLKRWDAAGIFGENFGVRVTQLLGTKYSICIPYTALTLTLSQTQSQLPKPKSADADIPFEKIISDLNEKTKQGYRPDSKTTRDKIKARWNEGWRLNDFLHVNSVMAAQWNDDPQMRQYLRPITLYGNKFEGYRQLQLQGPPKSKADLEFERSIDAGSRAVERTKQELAETFGVGGGGS